VSSVCVPVAVVSLSGVLGVMLSFGVQATCSPGSVRRSPEREPFASQPA